MFRATEAFIHSRVNAPRLQRITREQRISKKGEPKTPLRRCSPLTTHTYTLHDGRVVYSKGNDHIIDAVR